MEQAAAKRPTGWTFLGNQLEAQARGAGGKIDDGPIWTILRNDRAQGCTDTACNIKLADLELTFSAASAALNDNAYKLLRLTGRPPGRPAAVGQPVPLPRSRPAWPC